MAIEKHTRDIGAFTYEVSTLDALKGRRAFVRLFNTMGNVLTGAETNEDLIANLMSKLTAADLDHFCDLFGAVTTVTGGDYGDKTPLLTGATFQSHFAGNYLDLAEWLAFCIEVNFGNFFSGVEGLMARVAPKLAATMEPKKE